MAPATTARNQLHVSVITPASKAVAFFTGDDTVDLDDVDWLLPQGCAPGDEIFHVTGSTRPAIIEWDHIIDGPHSPDGLDFESIEFYPDGVSVAAVERRLGCPFPSLPGTINPDLADKVRAAVLKEAEAPTPWRELSGEQCAQVPWDSGAYAAYGCPVCERKELDLEWHVTDHPDDVCREIAVCRDCHDRLHSPVEPQLADLLGEGRPPCPSCSAEHTVRVLWGFPPGPPPPGYETAGCVIFGVTHEFRCGECGLSWTEDDSYYPRVPTPTGDMLVRARIAGTVMRPELEHPRLRQNGRLVIGRYAGPPDHGVDPAWESDGQTCVLLGEDGRIYNVTPKSIRSTEPRDRLDEPQETTVIVDHAEPELFEALESDNGQVTLASPYLSEPVALRLADLAERSRHEWYLLTCLDPRAAANHYLSTAGLTRLLEAGVMIQHCPQLHAKAYVVGTSFAMIGSANLTGAGLGSAQASNLELSVTLPRPEVPRVQDVLDQWWDEGFEVGQADIDRLERQAAALPPDPRPGPPAPRPPGDLDAVVDQLLNEARQDDVGLWIKTLDGTPDPDDWISGGWFSSSKKPSCVPGDLVLLYSKKERGCVAVVEIAHHAEDDPDLVSDHQGEEAGRRWPWVNHALPRFMPYDPVAVTPRDLNIKPQGLQGGPKKLQLNQFETGVRALAAGCQRADANGGFVG
ncbi:phospholipase D-like domain-containing protein [Dietzia kunjamensis]|uniref:phospholipase D-like domain-containing protein n=1 Tax=Dietzia kunjamensis TaxID=322509 RepID=UPI0039BCD46D